MMHVPVRVLVRGYTIMDANKDKALNILIVLTQTTYTFEYTLPGKGLHKTRRNLGILVKLNIGSNIIEASVVYISIHVYNSN